MKNIIVLIILLGCLMASCSKDENNEITFSTSTKSIQFEEQGGEYKIGVDNENFIVYKILDNNNKIIYGDIYSLNNNLIEKDVPLSLSGLGNVKTTINNTSFTIERSTPTTLNIVAGENNTSENLNFTIILKSSEKEIEVTVRQNLCLGYDFKSIEYNAKINNVTDSIYSRRGIDYTVDDLKSRDYKVNPILDSYESSESYFKSSDESTFYWAKKEAFSVKTPKDIKDGHIYYNIYKDPFTNITTLTPLNDSAFELTMIPCSGVDIKYYYMIEFRKRIIPYTLTLINKHTKKEKMVEGEWIENVPTGKYRLNLVIILDKNKNKSER